jgi:hypothetical protein
VAADFDHGGVNARFRQRVGEHQPCGPGSHDGHLGGDDPACCHGASRFVAEAGGGLWVRLVPVCSRGEDCRNALSAQRNAGSGVGVVEPAHNASCRCLQDRNERL